MRYINMKLLFGCYRLICNCVNIVYLYLNEVISVFIHEELIPQSSGKFTRLLRLPIPDSHPTFTERPFAFHNPSKGYLHIHHPSKGYYPIPLPRH